MKVATLLLACLVCAVSARAAAVYDAFPFGFAHTKSMEADNDAGVSVLIRVNITAEDLAAVNVTIPGLNIRFKKASAFGVGSLKMFITKDVHPSIERDTVIAEIGQCTFVGLDCWKEGTLANVSVGTYWVGFSGSCTACFQSVDLEHVTATLTSAFNVKQPFLITAKQPSWWTPDYNVKSGTFTQPSAKVIVPPGNNTNVYVEMDSRQDLQRATVQLVFQRDTWPMVWPTQESDSVKSYPHPGGTMPGGEWKTGAYSLGPGTWFITAYGGDTNTDYRLRYGVGTPPADVASPASALSLSWAGALLSLFLANFLF